MIRGSISRALHEYLANGLFAPDLISCAAHGYAKSFGDHGIILAAGPWHGLESIFGGIQKIVLKTCRQAIAYQSAR